MSEAPDPLAESANLSIPGTRGPTATAVAVVAIGGAGGALARYGVTEAIGSPSGTFPWATFAINMSGSFALGLILALLTDRWTAPGWARPLITTGFIGAYTTWSTFAVEADLLVKSGRTPLSIGYVAASLLVGLMAVWAGMSIARAAGSVRRLP